MKVVLTGGPCSGKSTLINKLKDLGHKIISETAREVIEKRNQKFIDKNEIIYRQKEIYSRQLNKENQESIGFVFLDRSIIDGIAYCNFFNIDHSFINTPLNKRYGLIFLLEQFPFENDGIRVEKKHESLKIHDLIRKTYLDFGYDLINVPKDNLEKRASFILNYINQLKGGDENGDC